MHACTHVFVCLCVCVCVIGYCAEHEEKTLQLPRPEKNCTVQQQGAIFK